MIIIFLLLSVECKSGINVIGFEESAVRSTDFEIMTDVRAHRGNIYSDVGKTGFTTGCPTFGYVAGMSGQAWAFGQHFTNSTNVYLIRD